MTQYISGHDIPAYFIIPQSDYKKIRKMVPCIKTKSYYLYDLNEIKKLYKQRNGDVPERLIQKKK